MLGRVHGGVCARSIKVVPQTLTEARIALMQAMTFRVQDIAGGPAGGVQVPPDAERTARGGQLQTSDVAGLGGARAGARETSAFAKFHESCGDTAGCLGCQTAGRAGTKHNMACRERRAEWESGLFVARPTQPEFVWRQPSSEGTSSSSHGPAVCAIVGQDAMEAMNVEERSAAQAIGLKRALETSQAEETEEVQECTRDVALMQ